MAESQPGIPGGHKPSADREGLEADGILTGAGKKKWRPETIKKILQNEKLMPISEYFLIFRAKYSIIGTRKKAVYMIIRNEYLNQLLAWKNEQVIKVVTGIRRCGKSTLLAQFQDHLLQEGVSDEQIISVNFEDLDYEDLLDYKALYAYIKERLCPDKMAYIFLDEIQKVDSFQKAVDSLFIKDNTDIYITGSNAYLFSGDLATFLTGRYVEISMLPLSFAEYLECSGESEEQALAKYMQFGGFPYLSQMENMAEKVDTYLEGIYNTVVVKDIEDRQARKISGFFWSKGFTQYSE